MQSRSPHQLESFLQSQKADGRLEEAGHFTLHKEKALQKIAQYNLPYPDAWALRVAQASVLSGADRLKVELLSTETHFSFTPSDLEEMDFEAVFFDPAPPPDHGLEALRSALWFAGVGQKRPFQITLPHQSRSFIWNGHQLTVQEQERRSPKLQLSVSIRSMEEGAGLPILRSIEAARYNNRLDDSLKQCLFPMPIPVVVDGQRVDGFHHSPTHGSHSKSNPLHYFSFQEPGPLISPPTDCYPSVLLQEKKLQGLSNSFLHCDFSQPYSLSCLLTAHGGLYQGGKSSSWRSEPQRSTLSWVRHGVIIQREQIAVPKLCVSVSAHLGADDLPTDLTGFALQEDQAAPRRQEALRLIAGQLQEIAVNFEVLDQSWYAGQKMLAGAALVGGVGLKLLAGPIGLPFIFAGVAGGISILQGPEALCRKFANDYEKLQREWRIHFPATDTG